MDKAKKKALLTEIQKMKELIKALNEFEVNLSNDDLQTFKNSPQNQRDPALTAISYGNAHADKAHQMYNDFFNKRASGAQVNVGDDGTFYGDLIDDFLNITNINIVVNFFKELFKKARNNNYKF